MCGLNLRKLFSSSPQDNLDSQSSEKHLYSNRTISTNRTVDEDEYSLPPPQLPRYHSAPAVPKASLARGTSIKSSKRGGLKRNGTISSVSTYTSNITPHAITSPQPIHSYAFTTPLQTAPSAREAQWIHGATSYAREYMRIFDSSHDFAHVQRVLNHALHILYVETSQNTTTRFDPTIVALSALLHDVGDKKYTHKFTSLHNPSRPKRLAFADEEPSTSSSSEETTNLPRHHRNHSRPTPPPTLHDPMLAALLTLSHDDPDTLVKRVLLTLGAPQELARTVQRIVKNVSYSHEILDPAHVRGVMLRHPELAIVQDADRLDALGAIGIGRCFTYGGASSESAGMQSGGGSAMKGKNSTGSMAGSRISGVSAGGHVQGNGLNGANAGANGKGRTLQDSVDHFEDKLVRLEGMMKTREGKRLARIRTERLRVFRHWWEEEMSEVGG